MYSHEKEELSKQERGKGAEIFLYASPSKQLTHHLHTQFCCANLQVCYSFSFVSVPLSSRQTQVAEIRASVHAKA